jgi:3'(2'), 5'-bisphosphate nucleotidase
MTMGSDNPEILPFINLCIAAGEAIMQVYNSPFSVEYKEDNSPLTLADKLSHEIIATGLKKHSSSPVISEEMEQVEYYVRKAWKSFWLVDPLDGTKEFIKRNGEFTVNIALVEDGAPVMGFIYQPVQRIMYYAVKGQGSFRLNNLKTTSFATWKQVTELSERLPTQTPEGGTFTIVASRSHNSPETEAYIDAEKKKHGSVNIVSAGSSIKFCLVSEGKANAYPRFVPTMEWDTAAGQIIAEETGKKVVLPDGKTPLTYNKESLVNPYFLVI